jgi:hypothetical protein
VKCNTKNQTAQAVSVQNLTKDELASACGKMISKITPLSLIALDMVGEQYWQGCVGCRKSPHGTWTDNTVH